MAGKVCGKAAHRVRTSGDRRKLFGNYLEAMMGRMAEEETMAQKTEKPKITVILEPGTYLVNVHPAYNPRVWRFTGEGFEGHGSKLKRAQAAYAVNELIAPAVTQEGTGPSYHRS